ncbi:MAG: tRNA uridine(34) 5-carboxymethylaminomethyl modification radical SAM/GNAT enzyme Elp3, partial [Candidatus Nanohaloarchaea archaeon]|nr:tRNA uridine(34) 5-carboxymethylaminomethyl modification radical SAM/GNAT enzyme Elp3 [Candidatus Nanohaloarchaea archaeon]
MEEDEAREVIEKVKAGEVTDGEELREEKRELASRMDTDRIPSNTEILEHATEEEWEEVSDVLGRKPTRTISGVATIAVMWMWDGFSCPYDCIYCPQGEHEGTEAPKSYTGKEPSARRAIDNAYDPYDQVKARLEQFRK